MDIIINDEVTNGWMVCSRLPSKCPLTRSLTGSGGCSPDLPTLMDFLRVTRIQHHSQGLMARRAISHDYIDLYLVAISSGICHFNVKIKF